MQTLEQDGVPSYRWEDRHFLLWLKPSPHFLFLFLVNHKKQVALSAEGESG